MFVEAVLWFGVLVALLGLSVDGGRLFWFKSQTSFIANSAATVAAKNLTKQPGAVAAAQAAAQSIIAANSAMLDPLTTLNAPSIQICETINPCSPTNNDTLATYAVVQVSGQITPIFWVPITLSASSAAVGG
jgi:uncharacterized membrane protein